MKTIAFTTYYLLGLKISCIITINFNVPGLSFLIKLYEDEYHGFHGEQYTLRVDSCNLYEYCSLNRSIFVIRPERSYQILRFNFNFNLSGCDTRGSPKRLALSSKSIL